jgi:hypothetical protein
MSNATLESVRAAIGAIIKAVPEIGVVHPYERYSVQQQKHAQHFMWQPPGRREAEMRGWFIRRIATREIDDTSTRSQIQIDWQIRGFMAIQDALASEITFDNLIEQIRDAFRADLTLGGLLDVALPAGAPLGPQLVESVPYMMAGVLCHGARLDWTTRFNRSQAEADPSSGEFRIFHANWDVPPIGNVQPPTPADATADATDHVLTRGE